MPKPFKKEGLTDYMSRYKEKSEHLEEGLRIIKDKIINEGCKLVNVEELLDLTIEYLDEFNDGYKIAKEYSNHSTQYREVHYISPNDPGDENDNLGDDLEYNYG
tara:strand:+ start:567 stop:878 length:312 start_codon:yes stop_codon:yes gene_type:complete